MKPVLTKYIEWMFLVTSIILTSVCCSNKFVLERVVFSSDYTPHFKLGNNYKLINLTTNDIAKVDSIFQSRYNIDLTGKRIAWFKPLKDVNEYYKYHNRQYLGYKDGAGETKVLITFLNFRDTREAEEKFSDWRKNIIFGFGEFYELNIRRFEVNIREKTLRLF